MFLSEVRNITSYQFSEAANQINSGIRKGHRCFAVLQKLKTHLGHCNDKHISRSKAGDRVAQRTTITPL